MSHLWLKLTLVRRKIGANAQKNPKMVEVEEKEKKENYIIFVVTDEGKLLELLEI